MSDFKDAPAVTNIMYSKCLEQALFGLIPQCQLQKLRRQANNHFQRRERSMLFIWRGGRRKAVRLAKWSTGNIRRAPKTVLPSHLTGLHWSSRGCPNYYVARSTRQAKIRNGEADGLKLCSANLIFRYFEAWFAIHNTTTDFLVAECSCAN